MKLTLWEWLSQTTLLVNINKYLIFSPCVCCLLFACVKLTIQT